MGPGRLYAQTEWGVASAGFYQLPGMTVRHWAACTGNRALLQIWVSLHFGVNIQTRAGRILLHMASQYAIVKQIFAHGAGINPSTPAGQTRLLSAVLQDSLEMAWLKGSCVLEKMT